MSNMIEISWMSPMCHLGLICSNFTFLDKAAYTVDMVY